METKVMTATNLVPFGEMAEVQSDGGRKLKQKEYLLEGILPVVDQGATLVGGYTNDEKLKYDGPLPVLVFGDHTRNFKIIDFEFAVGADGVKLFTARDGVDSSYLYYMLLAVELPNRGYSRHFQFLKKAQLPLAPLPDQKRIVSAIETQLGRLDAAVARLHAAKAQLKRYKQAVLKAAVENTEFDTQQDLGSLCELITSGSRGWAEYYAESGDTFIRAQNLKYDVLDLADIAYVRLPEKVDGLRTQVRKNDILITITGANVTKTALVTEELEGRAFVNQHIALVRLKDPSQAPFVFRWIISPAHGRGILEKLAYGAGKPGLNLSHIRDLRIPLPSPEDQAVVVERLGAIDLGNDELESTLGAQLEQSTRLRQAVLKQAFEGRLVGGVEPRIP